jgi:hypothetical protein
MDSDRRRQNSTDRYRWHIYRQNRSNQIALAGESVMEGRKSSKFRALFHGAGIGTKTRYSREQSDACAEVILFDRELNNAECATVERYLELKYGFKTTTDVTDGWKDQPMNRSSAPTHAWPVKRRTKTPKDTTDFQLSR